jgi:hypothetical protein
MEKKSNHSKKDSVERTSQPQIPAVPPPDDPLQRSTEFDADREYKSRLMAEKRLEAIRKTREMPTVDENSADSEPDGTVPTEESDST